MPVDPSYLAHVSTREANAAQQALLDGPSVLTPTAPKGEARETRPFPWWLVALFLLGLSLGIVLVIPR